MKRELTYILNKNLNAILDSYENMHKDLHSVVKSSFKITSICDKLKITRRQYDLRKQNSDLWTKDELRRLLRIIQKRDFQQTHKDYLLLLKHIPTLLRAYKLVSVMLNNLSLNEFSYYHRIKNPDSWKISEVREMVNFLNQHIDKPN